MSKLSKIFNIAKHEMMKELRYIDTSSRPKKILFDHLPKCAGSSLNFYLAKHYPRRKIFSINGSNPTTSIDIFKNKSERERHSYELIKGHLGHELMNFVHPETIKITILREPVERVISHYYYAKRTPQHYMYKVIHDSNVSLDDYVSLNPDGELSNWYISHFTGLSAEEVKSKPQYSISKASAEVIERYDLIGFLDKYSEFIENLKRLTKLRDTYKHVKINTTVGRPSIDDIPLDTIQKITESNAIDIDFYNNIKSNAVVYS